MDDKKIIAILIGCLAVGYLDVNLLLIPQQRALKANGDKINKLKLDIANIKRDIENIKKQPVVKEEKKFKPKQFISEGDIPSLLSLISEIANRNKINLEQIKPSREAPPKEEKGKPQQQVKFIPLNISLDISGDYHNIGSFINTLENADKFFSVEQLKIIGNPSSYFQQKASLVLRTYVKQ